jgi:hypothetical protein
MSATGYGIDFPEVKVSENSDPHTRQVSAIHIDIHPEDGACSVCRIVGKPATFDAARARRPKLRR